MQIPVFINGEYVEITNEADAKEVRDALNAAHRNSLVREHLKQQVAERYGFNVELSDPYLLYRLSSRAVDPTRSLEAEQQIVVDKAVDIAVGMVLDNLDETEKRTLSFLSIAAIPHLSEETFNKMLSDDIPESAKKLAVETWQGYVDSMWVADYLGDYIEKNDHCSPSKLPMQKFAALVDEIKLIVRAELKKGMPDALRELKDATEMVCSESHDYQVFIKGDYEPAPWTIDVDYAEYARQFPESLCRTMSDKLGREVMMSEIRACWRYSEIMRISERVYEAMFAQAEMMDLRQFFTKETIAQAAVNGDHELNAFSRLYEALLNSRIWYGGMREYEAVKEVMKGEVGEVFRDSLKYHALDIAREVVEKHPVTEVEKETELRGWQLYKSVLDEATPIEIDNRYWNAVKGSDLSEGIKRSVITSALGRYKESVRTADDARHALSMTIASNFNLAAAYCLSAEIYESCDGHLCDLTDEQAERLLEKAKDWVGDNYVAVGLLDGEYSVIDMAFEAAENVVRENCHEIDSMLKETKIERKQQQAQAVNAARGERGGRNGKDAPEI